MKYQRFAPIFVLALIAGVAAIPLVGRTFAPRSIELHARLPEQGGWSLQNISVPVGEPLTLKLTSDDVTHGFAVGQVDFKPVDVEPGKFNEVTITFDQPGKYTFYCNRWCGLDHWRMRGVIEVLGSEDDEQPVVAAPLYAQLGIDLDKPHFADILPERVPDASRGQSLAAVLPDAFLTVDFYRSRSPSQIWESLRADQSLDSYTDQQLWDAVAYMLWMNTTPEALQQGRDLYQQNCSACHGETGAGNGVLAKELADADRSDMKDGISGHSLTAPADFSDPSTALGASPTLLHGKILRGGMGTGMPYWGPIFTEEQLWALVAYIQSFQYEMETSK